LVAKLVKNWVEIKICGLIFGRITGLLSY